MVFKGRSIPFKFQSVLALAFLALIVSSCARNNTGIPLVAVDREINITLPSNQNLAVVGGWMYLSGGSQGLLIYRRSIDEFVAYDRHSPFEVDMECVVSVDSNNIECVDPCSGSRFSLYSGDVTLGPAALPLKQYQTFFNGTILRIYN